MTDIDNPQEAQNEPEPMAQSAYNSYQAPVLLSYVAASRGFVPPDPSSSYVYCDIGCGRGLTLNTLAAANPQARFIGVEPNGGSLAQARAQAEAGELTNVEFIEADFESIGGLDLPELDYVSLQGIYSRLSETALSQLFELLTRCLRPGGLLYVEYVSLPGNTDVVAIMKVWRELAASLEGGDDEPVVASIALLESLREAKLPFFKSHPLASNAVQRYYRLGQSRPEAMKLLGQQLLSSAWRPRFFSEMTGEMAALGLVHAGNTELPLNDLALCVPEAKLSLFDKLTDPVARGVLQDTLRNQQQRRDVFIRGGEQRPVEADAFLASRFHLIPRSPQPPLELSVPLPGGTKYTLSGPLHSALLTVMQRGPQRLADIYAAKELEGADAGEVATAAKRLIATGYCILALSGDVRAPLRVLTGELSYSNAFNRALVAQAANNFWRATLACQLTGGGMMSLLPMEAIFLDVLMAIGPDNIATVAKGRLEESNKKFSMDGKVVAARDVDLKTIRAALARFRSTKLNNLFRFAVLESPRADLTLEGADDVFEFE